jgi:phosphoglycolate phosphatase-like HAD superfamily hydrolase
MANHQTMLPSWEDTGKRQAILDFVGQVTNEGGSGFVPPDHRIAVFDNDGTLWCEKPMYIQLAFILQHMAAAAESNPDLRDQQPWKAAYQGDEEWLAGVVVKHYQGDDSDLHTLLGGILRAFAEMPVDQFEAQAHSFLRSEQHPTLARPYIACTYTPMLELLDLLTQHGFTNYIASGGGRDFMRPVTEELYGIPRERVIGSSAALKFEPDGGGGRIIHLSELDVLTDGPQKPVGIWNQIGRRPILAAGNSNGDIDMMQFIEHPSRPSLGILIKHDDGEREFDYQQGAEIALETAGSRGWTLVSMREDWKKIF